MRWLFVIAALAASLQSSALSAAEVPSPADAVRQLGAMNWYSEEYPPYNFRKDGKLKGFSVDILMAAFDKIGVKITRNDIKIVPWNRSYKFVQRNPGTALFSMTYTPEREKLMKFVGPAAPIRIAIIAPKAKKLKGLSLGKLSTLKIGVVRDDIGDQLLRKIAISDGAIQRKNSLKQLIYLLKKDRVDAVAYAVDVFNFAMKNDGEDPKEFEEAMLLKEGAMGYAFHKSTDPAVLAHLQKAMDELRREGRIEAIISSYTK